MKSIKTKAILVGLIFLLAIIATVIATSLTNAFAFTGFKGTSKAEQLFNATNTYQVDKITSKAKDLTSRSITYKMSDKVSKSIMEKPQITVLTHGLNGDASHWSNNYSQTNTGKKDSGTKVEFAYDPDSLISKIDEKVGGANIYWAKMKLEKKPKEMSEEKAKIEVLPSGLPIEEDDF